MADIILNDPVVKEFIFWASRTWFLWMPILFFFIFRDSWLHYVRANFISTKKYILLEVRIPREVSKSPKAMESIFAGIHGAARKGNLIDRYWDGWVTPWFSLEVIGDETGIHFYIWTMEFFKRMFEAQIYAQYPSSEVRVVEDYTKSLPAVLPDKDWNLWGTEFVLTKPDAYPIRTYEDFVLEDISSKEEERKIDPLSSLFEFFGQLRPGERLWIQMLVRAADDKWKKEGEVLVAKMTGKKAVSKSPLITQLVDAIHDTVKTILGVSAESKPTKKESDQFRMLNLSPGERTTIEAIERNIAKIGFEVCIRWIYLAKREVYNFLAVPAMFGIFKQFSSQSLNGFKTNKKITVSIDYFFKNYREPKRKQRLFKSYKLRSVFLPPYKRRSKPFVLSSSELATVYHFPGMVVAAPTTPRIEAKRGAPPPNLPI